MRSNGADFIEGRDIKADPEAYEDEFFRHSKVQDRQDG